MKFKDYLQRFVFENRSVRGELVRLEESYQTITEQHKYPELIRHLLGETLAATSLLSAIIKFKGRLMVQFQGNGKLSLLLAQADDAFHIRGLAQWNSELQKSDLQEALKKGILNISIEHENTGQRYQGVVAWKGNSLAQSLEGYFNDSEQLATRIWLAVDDTRAVGLLLQVIPQELKNQETTQTNDWEHVTHLASTITSEELLNCDNTTLLHRLYSEDEVRVFTPQPVTFQCTCSQQRSENAILLVGQEEIEEELEDKQKIVVTCEFCNKEYHFDRIDIMNIFKRGGETSKQVH